MPLPRFARMLRPAVRFRMLAAYPRAAVRRPGAALHYLLRGRELTNFTYPVENLDELATVIARALGSRREDVRALMREAEEDGELRAELGVSLRRHPEREDEPHFGRRFGWYAVVRTLGPQLVVETGVHDGLGSALIVRALERNGGGKLLGFDIDPTSGWLVPHRLRGKFELIVGDIRDTLEPALNGRTVGVFVHDSLHTYAHEHWEIGVVLRHAADRIALISDNAHATTALADICCGFRTDYAVFRERPREHFYPGATLGICVLERRAGARLV